MLDETLVFHRTESGERQAAGPAPGLAPGLRRALGLVDGERPLGEIALRLRAGEAQAVFERLLALGLVALPEGSPAPAPGPAASPPPAPGPERLDEIRRLAIREISDRLGPNGDALARRIEACRTPAALREALLSAGAILATHLGADYGRRFAGRIAPDLAPP